MITFSFQQNMIFVWGDGCYLGQSPWKWYSCIQNQWGMLMARSPCRLAFFLFPRNFSSLNTKKHQPTSCWVCSFPNTVNHYKQVLLPKAAVLYSSSAGWRFLSLCATFFLNFLIHLWWINGINFPHLKLAQQKKRKKVWGETGRWLEGWVFVLVWLILAQNISETVAWISSQCGYSSSTGGCFPAGGSIRYTEDKCICS